MIAMCQFDIIGKEMRKTTVCVFLLIFLTLISCRVKTVRHVQVSSLQGKWKFKESLVDPGDGSGKWAKVPEGTELYIQFLSYGKIASNYFPEAINYKVANDSTIAITSKDKKIQEYYYNLDTQTLLISPTRPLFCIEGCAYKFVKVEE